MFKVLVINFKHKKPISLGKIACNSSKQQKIDFPCIFIWFIDKNLKAAPSDKHTKKLLHVKYIL